ncbi:hypothetical protein AVEN_191543-1 [Araneus ventricosus]|uniref:Uncharacterized protein n=1 Tax=Araneus ventricosus TaxID=182803 RepID=A0A4Y2GCT6_ARAVE|nr:hypothetical protein AVEN_191543-1 [Araneus ventricosus]
MSGWWRPGYVRDDAFRIGGSRRKSRFNFILGIILWPEKKYLIVYLLGFAAFAPFFPFGDKCANVTNLNELLPSRKRIPRAVTCFYSDRHRPDYLAGRDLVADRQYSCLIFGPTRHFA